MKTPPTLIAALRTLPRPVWILCFGTFLNKFGAFVVPFLTLYLTRQGYSLTQAGLAVSAYGVGNLCASLLGGHLADQLGRRRTIVLSMFLGAAMMILLSQAHSLGAIMLLCALTGLASEFYRPACSALLTDVVSSGQRVTAFAAMRMSFNAGFAFGPATAGVLAVFGFFWLFIGDAATSLMFGLVALLALPKGAPARENYAGWGTALKVLWRDRQFHQMLAANLAIGILFFQMASTFGLYVTQLGFSAATYGALISLNGALIVFCELPLVAVTQRFPVRRVMAVGYLVIACGFALNWFAHTIPALVACMVVFTVGEMITMPMASAYIAGLAPANLRGRYLGVSGLTWSVSLIVGPAAGLKLFAWNPAVYFAAFGSLGLLAAAIITTPVKPREIAAIIPAKAEV